MNVLEHAYSIRELVRLHPCIRDAVGSVFVVVQRLPSDDPFDGPEYLLESLVDGSHVIIDEALIEGRAVVDASPFEGSPADDQDTTLQSLTAPLWN